MKTDRGNRKLRFLDRYLGIPLVFFLGLFHRKKSRPENIPRRIGIMETAAIGDTILLSPVIEDIRKTYPETEIILFCGRDNQEIAKEIKNTNKVELLEITRFCRSVRAVRKNGEFDVWLDFGPWPRINSIFSFFARSSYKVGFKAKRQYKHYIFHRAVSHRDDCHEIENYRRMVKEIGVVSRRIPKFNIPGNIKKQAVVHMFPGGHKAWSKAWESRHWIEVINFIVEHGFRVIVTGGREDSEQAERIVSQCRNQVMITNIAGKVSLLETARYLKEARLTISVNTGIMHLAAAIGSPVIALQGPTDVKRWGALGSKVMNINSTKECAPCLHFGFDYQCKKADCMHFIKPATVMNAIREILNLE